MATPKPKCAKCKRVARDDHTCPAPKPIARTPIKRPARSHSERGKPRKAVKRRNPKRERVNFLRVYHSRERQQFVASLPCIVLQCWEGPCHGHHTQHDGMGRKGPYQSVVSLCAAHHDGLHRMGVDSFLAAYPLRHGWTFADHAAETERLWLAYEADGWKDGPEMHIGNV